MKSPNPFFHCIGYIICCIICALLCCLVIRRVPTVRLHTLFFAYRTSQRRSAPFATRMYHSSSPIKGASATSSPRVRKRPSAYLEVSTIGSCPSVVSLDEMAELEDSVASLRRKPSNDEFSRIVSEISMHRRMNTSLRSRRSHQSLASSDDGRSGHSRVGQC